MLFVNSCEFPISLTSFAWLKQYLQILSRNKFLPPSLSHTKRASNSKLSQMQTPPFYHILSIWFTDSLLTQRIRALTGLSGTRSWRASHTCCGQLLQVDPPSALWCSMDGPWLWMAMPLIIWYINMCYIMLYIYILYTRIHLYIDFDIDIGFNEYCWLRPKFIPALTLVEDLHRDESWLLIRWEHFFRAIERFVIFDPVRATMQHHPRVVCNCSFHWFVLYLR